MGLKLKSQIVGKKQVVIRRLIFTERMLAPRFEWKNLEGAFLQNRRVFCTCFSTSGRGCAPDLRMVSYSVPV